MRGAAARTAIALLTAVLLAFSLFAPEASFASAHTGREVVANATPGLLPAATVQRETVLCPDAGRPGDPSGPARTRDRHRAAAAPGHGTAERPLTGRHLPAVPSSSVSPAGHPHPSRPSADRTPAVLQVFRC
ncbi:hypothetical protein GCM10018772_39700 [Streptomyces fumanus]|uniref:Secreted protein n=2 Tax=Streptomyces fumanus TaxID=67302 RepID=A0A919AJ75_9ACTN|nr:hypothetical protein GCM10018772_39700 [Streptomyces fumanus]